MAPKPLQPLRHIADVEVIETKITVLKLVPMDRH
jgi:hypothetical protein